MSEPVLEIEELHKHFKESDSLTDTIKSKLAGKELGEIRAVDGVSLTLEQNQVQGIIGESGCGKTTLLENVIGLQQATSGRIKFNGKSMEEFRKGRWKDFTSEVQIIFQDPFNSLDPKFTVEEALREQLKIHNMDRGDNRIKEVLEDVQLTPPETYLDELPQQLSGGEKQRVGIAKALIPEPSVILADEPVSMLDVSTQASILELLSKITNENDISMLYISHDLSTVSYVCDIVNVMYLGKIVESAPTMELLDNPKHPYTQALVQAIPIPDPYHDRDRTLIKSQPPDPTERPEGCRFKDRCPEVMDICDQDPEYIEVSDSHVAKCHLYNDLAVEGNHE